MLRQSVRVLVPKSAIKEVGFRGAIKEVGFRGAIKEVGFRGAIMKGQWVRVRVRVG